MIPKIIRFYILADFNNKSILILLHNHGYVKLYNLVKHSIIFMTIQTQPDTQTVKNGIRYM